MMYYTPALSIPLNQTAGESKGKKFSFKQPWTNDYRDEYVISGVKPPALQSLIERDRVKASKANEMSRGESDCSNTKTGKPTSWGFSSYNSRVFQYAIWVHIGQGLYLQTWLELESDPDKDWDLNKQSKDKNHLPEQMGFTEDHRIRSLCVRLIHVNAVRAGRPTNALTVLHG